jgi:hypothetical protein
MTRQAPVGEGKRETVSSWASNSRRIRTSPDRYLLTRDLLLPCRWSALPSLDENPMLDAG